MTYAIRMVRDDANTFQFLPGVYLSHYDADGNDGKGSFEFTTDLDDALTFASPREAAEFTIRTSTVEPLTIDKMLNMPLFNAFSISIEQVP